MKHKKLPVQFEWESSKESFDQVINTLTNELKEHGLKHFDMFEEISTDNRDSSTTSVNSFIDSMTPPDTWRVTTARTTARTKKTRNKKRDEKE